MKLLNKSTIAVFVLGVVFAGSINVAKAAANPVTTDNIDLSVSGNDGANYDLQKMGVTSVIALDVANDAATKADAAQAGVNANAQLITTLNQKVNDNKADQIITDNKQDVLITDTENKANTALQGVVTNGQAIIDTNTKVDKAESDASLAGAKADTALTNATDAKSVADHAEITATNANTKADANTAALATKVESSTFQADQDRQDKALSATADKATQAFNTGAYAQSVAVDAQTVAAANKAAVANIQSRQQAQETTIHNHSAQLANHESRITALESQNNEKLSSLENQQNEDRKEYRAGIAGAASIAGLHYVDTDNAVAIGAANFKDAQGYAIGYRHKFAENVAATLSTSGTSNGDEIVAASASIGW